MRFEGEMPIRLADIWPIAAPDNYKLNFARWNGENQPLADIRQMTALSRLRLRP
jgi:hypothetical protein